LRETKQGASQLVTISKKLQKLHFFHYFLSVIFSPQSQGRGIEGAYQYFKEL
jgi:hypothetical protein